MPIASTVTALSGPGLRTAGDCLGAIAAGGMDGCDLVIVPVEPGGGVGADEALDALLAAPAADVVRAAQLSGKAGQSAQSAIRVGESTIRVVFLGMGDRSQRALRRAGGELGRMLKPGERALTSVVADRPGPDVNAFAEGLLLGSYRYSQKAAARVDRDPQAVVRVLVADAVVASIDHAAVVAHAVAIARDLTNTPSIRKSPQWLADAAGQAAAGNGV